MYHIGYLGYYWYSVQELNDQWTAHVEITPDMKHVTIPIALPYWSETNYRPTNGSINIDGKLYRTVLEKYAKDAIHLIVAEDRGIEKLNNSISDWVKMMNTTDGQSSGTNKTTFLKSIAKDYLSLAGITLQHDSWELEDTSYNYISKQRVLKPAFDVITPPPQV